MMVLIKAYPDGLTVRTAEADDKDAVAQIEAFGELDYLRAMYDHFMENPDYHLFVGEMHERLVAFCYVRIMDDGETALRGGKRIHQDFRSKGYLSKFIDPVEDHVTAQFSNVKRWRFSAVNTDYQQRLMPMYRASGVLRRLVTRSCFFTMTNVIALKALAQCESMQKLYKDYDVSDVVRAKKGKIPDCLLSPARQRDLFPDYSVEVFWEPYRPNKSSLQYIMDTSECFITYSGIAQSKVKVVSFVSEVRTGERMWKHHNAIYIDKTLPFDEQYHSLKQHIARSYLQRTSKFREDDKLYVGFAFPRGFDMQNLRSWVFENFRGVYDYHLEPNKDEYIVCEYDRVKWARLRQNK